jgi:CRP-like cAMP-binding protein
MDIEKFLSTVKVFRKLDHEKLLILAQQVQVKHYLKGEIIVKQGTSGEYLWIIYQGSVKILRDVEGKEKKVLATLFPPDFFGEISLMSQSPTSAAVMAEEPSVIMRIPRDAVVSVVKKNISANACFSRTTIQRLTENARRLFGKQ